MTRVSLTEDYDDRSVISKLNEMDKRVKENASVVTSAEASARQSAQSAQETADRFAGSVGAVVQNANQQINSSKAQVDQSKAEVDETVTTVAQAVETANQASASAQASATTVATYGTRLTAVEDKAQGNSADIDHLEIETRDLYDRDANNVKLHANYTQIMEGGLDVGNPLITHGTETQKTSIPTSSTAYTERNIKEVLDANGTRFMRTFLSEQNNTKSVMTNLYGNDGNAKIQINDSISADGTVYTRQLIKNNHYVNAETINDAGQVFQYGSSPVEGSLSSTLVNKAYVETTNPATRLNNLLHTEGEEYASGLKIFEGNAMNDYRGQTMDPALWYKWYVYDGGGAQYRTCAYLFINRRTDYNRHGMLYFINNRNGNASLFWMFKGTSIDPNDFIATREGGNAVTLWVKGFGSTADGYQSVKLIESSSSSPGNNMHASPDHTGYEFILNDDGDPIGYIEIVEEEGSEPQRVEHYFTHVRKSQ